MARGDAEDHSKVAIDPDRPVKLRVNVTLDPEHAEKLEVLAREAYVNPGTMARSLLMRSIDLANAEASDLTAILRSIPGALESAKRGEEEFKAGLGISVEEWAAADGES